MVKTMTICRGDRHSKAIQFTNSPAGGGAVNIKGEVQTVSAMMPIHKCLVMILLAYK